MKKYITGFPQSNHGYVSHDGQLFIPTPCSDTFTIYPSIEHYNKRLCLPEFQKKDTINVDGYKIVSIDIETLTINEIGHG